MGPGLVLLVAIGAAALLRALGARSVREGHRRFVQLTLFATFMLAVLLVVVGVWAAARSLFLGVPVMAGALILGGGWLRVTLDLCRDAGPIGRSPDRTDILVARLDAAHRSIAGLLLGGGFVLAVAVVLWLLFRGGL